MEKAKKVRTAHRSAFTRTLNALNSLFGASAVDTKKQILVTYQLLEEKIQDLNDSSQIVINLLFEQTDSTDEMIQREYDEADDYKGKFIAAKLQVEDYISERNTTMLSAVPCSVQVNQRKTFNLPTIQLAKFSGDLREWLQFWSVFKKIHEDSSISSEDKFQYLLQAMVVNSRAAELVKSYPPTGENYKKVIDGLKNRFGREDLQIEVYVRELLQLVLQNALKTDKSFSLASLYDKIESHLRALETLGVATEKCAAMLFPLVESSLPEDLLRAWQRSAMRNDAMQMRDDSSSQCKDRLTQLIKFLEGEVQSELRISMAVEGFGLKTGNADKEKVNKYRTRAENKNIPSAMGLLTLKERNNSCLFCNSCDHESPQCERAKRMTLSERQGCARKGRACYNCLKIGHNFKQCRVKLSCGSCSRRHVLLMCPKTDRENSTDTVDPQSRDSDKRDFNLANLSSDPEVLMQTLCVKLRNGDKEIIVRAIIDSGSQRSYITKDVVTRLGYEPIDERTMTHSLFGGQKSDPVQHRKFRIYLSSLNDRYRCNFVVMDQSLICEEVPLINTGVWIKELKKLNIDISDTHNKSKSVSVLIGSDVAGRLYTGQIRVLDSGLVAMETFLGWFVSGKVPETERRNEAAITAVSLFVREGSISDLWALDVLGIKDPVEVKTRGQHDAEMQETFLKTVKINEERRYEVHLPWMQNHPALPNNKEMALRRLQSTVKKLKSEGLYATYNAVFEEWVAEGIIERVPTHEESNWAHYLPHRHVVKDNSTTRIRPVFDASAKERQFPSLNECLHTGPNLIELIPTVLLRFRKGKIGVVSDIRKAFLQISVQPGDRDFLRFLWLNGRDNVIAFRHCRVVFGVSSSPFILSAIIGLHLNEIVKSLENCEDTEMSVGNILKLAESFYVDNCVTSVDTREHLNKFMSDAISVMHSGGFDLRGWEYSDDNSHQNETNVLGIIWNKEFDTLSVNVPDSLGVCDTSVTKRCILSVANRVFDPLGFVCPVTLGPRVLLQETWNSNLKWDDAVPAELRDRFLKWASDLKGLREIQIPRCFLGSISQTDAITLHTFCDASKLAYATVIFMRVQGDSGVKVHFVQAKNRVAPAGKSGTNTRTSIPRLELLAATMGARLTKAVLDALNCKDTKIHYWSDSSTVLTWIQKTCNWATFVHNRVEEIRKLTTPGSWRHVPGHLNPADLPSRGCKVKQLLCSKWWEGPEWLLDAPENWPDNELVCDESEINEELRKSAEKKSLVCMLTASKGNEEAVEPFFVRFSRFDVMVRIFAWVRRFYYNCRSGIESRLKGSLAYEEIQTARFLLLRLIQTECFVDEEDSRIKHLNPFRAKDGLIRLKTKIILRDDVYNFKCPVVLPYKHHIVDLIIRKKHESLNHAGVEITMNALREEFWILGGRKVIRSVIKRCVSCRRHDSKPLESARPPLPLDRVRDASVFEVIGVDFTGPIYLKGKQKAWVGLFTCAVFRAVHLELVTSLSAASFLMALRRFIARRGRPCVIYSDNGTNFVGLNNMFRVTDFEKLSRTLATERIEWKFNPPTAAWWGGFWERMNGILKRLLRRTLKRSCLDYEEMLTVLLDCEAVINSRPITFLPESTHEIVPLTPSMFLQEIKEIGVLDLDNIEECHLSKRYLYRQRLKMDLRRRFRNEYLGALMHRKSNSKNREVVAIGDIVLVGSDNAKRLDWPVARVKELIVGKDNVVRVVRLTTANGELIRPIQRIYPLELNCGKGKCERDTVYAKKRESDKGSKTSDCIKNNDCDLHVNKRSEKLYVTRSGREIRKPERLSYGGW